MNLKINVSQALQSFEKGEHVCKKKRRLFQTINFFFYLFNGYIYSLLIVNFIKVYNLTVKQPKH